MGAPLGRLAEVQGLVPGFFAPVIQQESTWGERASILQLPPLL